MEAFNESAAAQSAEQTNPPVEPSKNPAKRMAAACKALWNGFKTKHPGLSQFLVFFAVSNGVTLLQFLIMPIFKMLFGLTPLISVNFQVLQIGKNFDGSNYYIFDYASGSLTAGGGGGLAYFLSVQLTIAIAQVINFFAQRNITFKADNSALYAAMWYVIAYVAITIIAAALQGLYKQPIYNAFINTLGWGKAGETTADMITMFINSAISFWVFFPIFKLIFRQQSQIQNEEIIKD